MISTRTVMLLGASANVPYQFSTGAGLLQKARGRDARADMGNAGLHITQRASDLFREAVEDSMLPSIDALLEHRSDLMQVGKRYMAHLLYQQERTAQPGPIEKDWMQLVFQYMAEGAADLEAFGRNAVTFVTFNYDRYLERRFMRALVSRYNILPHEAWRVLAPKIIHLYGSLGPLPEFSDPARQQLDAITWGAVDTPGVYVMGGALQAAEANIRIVHDQDPVGESFQRAQAMFGQAQQVFFLGFSFGRENVERLRANETIPRGSAVVCTAYGMTPAESALAVNTTFAGRNMSHLMIDEEIREFFRNRIQMLR